MTFPDSFSSSESSAEGPLRGEISNGSSGSHEKSDAELDRLRAELTTAEDRILRAQADLDNYQKRVQRERAEERRYAHLPLLRDLLGVWDNLHRAIAAAEGSDPLAGDAPPSDSPLSDAQVSEPAGLLEGVKLVAQQLNAVLAQHECQEIAARGAAFDPNLHEAVSTQPADTPSGTITAVLRPGFRLYDRVVRPAQVIVSTGPGENN